MKTITLTLRVGDDFAGTVARALRNVADHVDREGYGDCCWEEARSEHGTNAFSIDRGGRAER